MNDFINAIKRDPQEQIKKEILNKYNRLPYNY